MRGRLLHAWWAGRRALVLQTLLVTPLLDELASGVPVLTLPLVQADLGLSYAQAGLLFTAGELSSLAVEPALNLFSDRGSKRWPMLGGMLCLAIGFGVAAVAPSFPWLVLAFVLIYPASGAAVGLAQAVLVDAAVEKAPQTMTRWTLMASVGDLLTPALVAALLAVGLGWRALFWLAAALWLGGAAALWRQRFPAPPAIMDDTDRPGPVLAHLQEVLRTPRLLRWAAVVLLTALLDEIFLGFAALYLRDVVRVDAAVGSLVLGAQLAGALLGLIVLNRLLGRSAPERLLRGMTLIALVGGLGFLAARPVWLAAGALFVLGFGAAAWYPLAKAGAYALLPGRSGTVRALLIVLGAPLGLGLPVGVGLVAEGFGIMAGVALLALSPVAVLLIAPGRPSVLQPGTAARMDAE